MTLAADTTQTVVSTRPSPLSVSLTSVAANAQIVLFCIGDANNGNATESLSIGTTGGLTWTRQTQANGAGGAVAAIFTAPSGAGGNISITVIDSDGLANGSAELAVVPVVFTDTNGGTPGIGASGSDVANIVTTVDNGWVWFCAMSAGVTNGSQTVVYTDAAFDGGDQINTSKWNVTTAHGTTVTPTLGGTHGALIEITPGTGAAAPVVGYQSTARHPGRGPSNARFYQTPRSTDIPAAGNTVTIDATVPISAGISATAQETANATATIAVTATVAATATEVANAAATVTTTATVTAVITRAANVDTTEPITATISATAQEIANAQAAVATTATITAALSVGAAPVTIDTAVPVTAMITANAVAIHPVAAARPTTATITAAMSEAANAQASRPVTATIVAAANQTARAAATVPTSVTITAAINITGVISAGRMTSGTSVAGPTSGSTSAEASGSTTGGPTSGSTTAGSTSTTSAGGPVSDR